jgi:hypothetical protein
VNFVISKRKQSGSKHLTLTTLSKIIAYLNRFIVWDQWDEPLCISKSHLSESEASLLYNELLEGSFRINCNIAIRKFSHFYYGPREHHIDSLQKTIKDHFHVHIRSISSKVPSKAQLTSMSHSKMPISKAANLLSLENNIKDYILKVRSWDKFRNSKKLFQKALKRLKLCFEAGVGREEKMGVGRWLELDF